MEGVSEKSEIYFLDKTASRTKVRKVRPPYKGGLFGHPYLGHLPHPPLTLLIYAPAEEVAVDQPLQKRLRNGVALVGWRRHEPLHNGRLGVRGGDTLGL